MMTRLSSAAMLVALIGLRPIQAHETWLMPTTFTIAENMPVRFDLTSGMKFPELEHAIKPERIARAGYRLGKHEEKLDGWQLGSNSLQNTLKFPRTGLATVWIALHPKSIELKPESVEHYLDEIAASERVRTAWAAQKGREAWQERYTKHAKTFLTVGEHRDDESWKQPAGLEFELIPQTDPLGTAVGGRFMVQVLRSGQPLAEQAVGLIIQGSTERQFLRTNREGQATFQLSRAGLALLFAVDLRRDPQGGGWESHFTTMTFEVRPRP